MPSTTSSRRRSPRVCSTPPFKLPDGVTFIHLAEHGEPNPLSATTAFPRFLEGINDRCDEPPVVSQVDVTGSYRFFETGR